MKLILGIGVALLVAFGAGWAWGAAGRFDTARALRIVELRDGLLEARVAVLDARLNGLGVQEDAKRLSFDLARIDEAQRMTGQLNQDANALAADAAKAIGEVLGTMKP